MNRSRSPITLAHRQAWPAHRWATRYSAVESTSRQPVNSRRPTFRFHPACHRFYLQLVSVKYLCLTRSSHPIVSVARFAYIKVFDEHFFNVPSGWRLFSVKVSIWTSTFEAVNRSSFLSQSSDDLSPDYWQQFWATISNNETSFKQIDKIREHCVRLAIMFARYDRFSRSLLVAD